MQKKITNSNYLTGDIFARRRSFSSRILQKGLDLIQHLLLLVAFLMFFSFVQVATATESITGVGEHKNGGLFLLESKQERMRHTPIIKSDIEIRINDMTSQSKITQTFKNPLEQRVDGTYYFPLPKDALVESIKTVIGGRVQKELLNTDNKVSKIQKQKNIFTAEVKDIGPHETVKLILNFQQPVKYEQGKFILRMPMANIFNQTHSIMNNPSPVSLHIELDAGIPLIDIDSPHHDIVKLSHGVGRYSIRFKDGAALAHDDFKLIWTPEPGYAPRLEFNNNIHMQDQITHLNAQATSDSKIKIIIGILSASLSIFIRAFLFRFYPVQRWLKSGVV